MQAVERILLRFGLPTRLGALCVQNLLQRLNVRYADDQAFTDYIQTLESKDALDVNAFLPDYAWRFPLGEAERPACQCPQCMRLAIFLFELPCGHTVCPDCQTGRQACGSCGASVSLLLVAKGVDLGQSVKCCYAPHGCAVETSLRSAGQHWGQCEFRRVLQAASVQQLQRGVDLPLLEQKTQLAAPKLQQTIQKILLATGNKIAAHMSFDASQTESVQPDVDFHQSEGTSVNPELFLVGNDPAGARNQMFLDESESSFSASPRRRAREDEALSLRLENERLREALEAQAKSASQKHRQRPQEATMVTRSHPTAQTQYLGLSGSHNIMTYEQALEKIQVEPVQLRQIDAEALQSGILARKRSRYSDPLRQKKPRDNGLVLSTYALEYKIENTRALVVTSRLGQSAE